MLFSPFIQLITASAIFLLTFLSLLLWDISLIWTLLLVQSQLWYPLVMGTLIAVLFLLCGVFIWISPQKKSIVGIFSAFCYCMMIVFVVAGASSAKIGSARTLALCFASFALPILLTLFLIFPRNLIKRVVFWLFHSRNISYQIRGAMLVCLILCIWLGNLLFAFSSFLCWLWSGSVPSWLSQSFSLIYLLEMILCFLIVLYTLRRDHSHRAQHQLHVGMWGILSASVPLAAFTIIPALFGSPIIIDNSKSTLGCGVCALLLLSMLLLYHPKFPFHLIRSSIQYIISILGLLFFLLVLLQLTEDIPLSTLGIASLRTLLLAVVCPSWWIASQKTVQWLFSRRIATLPLLHLQHTLSIEEIASLLLETVKENCETRQVCLFLLDERKRAYILTPTFLDPTDEGRDQLLLRLSQYENVGLKGNIWHQVSPMTSQFWLADQDGLVIPLKVEKKVIALLALGTRCDQQSYTLLDVTLLERLISRFTPALELARKYSQTYAQEIQYGKMYTISKPQFSSLREAAKSYTRSAALLFGGSAVLWLAQEPRHWQILLHVGKAFNLQKQEWVLEDQDWNVFFFDGEQTKSAPPCLHDQATHLPRCAWLPIVQGERRLGILLLPFEGNAHESMLTYVRQMTSALIQMHRLEHLQEQLELSQYSFDAIRKLLSQAVGADRETFENHIQRASLMLSELEESTYQR